MREPPAPGTRLALEEIEQALAVARGYPWQPGHPGQAVIRLPRRKRAELWCHQLIDAAASWLCEHSMWKLAIGLYKVTGLWGKTRKHRA